MRNRVLAAIVLFILTLGEWRICADGESKSNIGQEERLTGCYSLRKSAWEPVFKLPTEEEFFNPPSKIKLSLEPRHDCYYKQYRCFSVYPESDNDYKKPLFGVAPCANIPETTPRC